MTERAAVAVVVGSILTLLAVEATAQGSLLPAGDGRLRSDVALLVDEGVLRLIGQA